MPTIKQLFKQNSHNIILKHLAGFGRALNRLYENRNHDSLSNGELTVLKKISTTSPSLIIDGGANTGKYAAMVSMAVPGCRIYSFEPVKSTFEKLREKQKTHVNIHPVNKGLFRENCSMEINLYEADEHSSLFSINGPKYGSELKEMIHLVSGDDFMKEKMIASVDFLKLDIEGAEFDALLGFEDSLKNGKIKVVQFEYGYINIVTKNLLHDYYRFFAKHDYVVGKIFPKRVEFREYNYMHEDFIGPNFIAVKRSETELIDLLSKN